MQLIDSHCHLDDDRFDGRRDSVLSDATAAGIGRIVVPATTAARWQKLKQVCAQQRGLFPAYGLHPWFTAEHEREHLDQLDAWLAREKPVALGECGLDTIREKMPTGSWNCSPRNSSSPATIACRLSCTRARRSTK